MQFNTSQTLLSPQSNNLLLPPSVKCGLINTLKQEHALDGNIVFGKKDFTLSKVNIHNKQDIVEYFTILQPHASTLLHKAILQGKSIADRILQIERNNLNGLTLKEYQAKYKINNQNRFQSLHEVKFLKLEQAKKEFYKKHLSDKVKLVGSEQEKTLQNLLKDALKYNMHQNNIGMFFVKDTKAPYISKSGNVKQRIIGSFGMVPLEINDNNQVTKCELVNHLKEEYTGHGLAKDIIMQVARYHLAPAIANNEFTNNARYVVETKIDNNASLRAQRQSVGLNFLEKLTGATLTEEEIPGSRIIRQEDSISNLGFKFNTKIKIEDALDFISCKSR